MSGYDRVAEADSAHLIGQTHETIIDEDWSAEAELDDRIYRLRRQIIAMDDYDSRLPAMWAELDALKAQYEAL